MSYEIKPVTPDPILFPGEAVAPVKPLIEQIPQISNVPLEQLAKYGLVGIDLTIQKATPSIILDAATAGDTDWWISNRNDGDGASDDNLEIGIGTTPGTTSKWRLDPNGVNYLIATAPNFYLQPADNTLNYARMTSSVQGSTYIAFSLDVRSQTYAAIWGLMTYAANTGSAATRDVLALAKDGNMQVVIGGTTKLTTDNSGIDIPNADLNIWHTRVLNFVHNAGSPGGAGTKYPGMFLNGTTKVLSVGPSNSGAGLALVGGAGGTMLTVDSAGLTITEAKDVVLGTTTGSKIGTATSQKLGFFNATPVVQQGATTDLGTVLSNLGLRASGTAYPITTSGAVNFTGGLTIATTALTITDVNVVLSATTGTKIATATSQKLGFWNATPVIQPAAANQAALTNSTTGTYDGTLVDVGLVFSQANINDNFTDVYTLLTEIRTALVNTGIIKGAA